VNETHKYELRDLFSHTQVPLYIFKKKSSQRVVLIIENVTIKISSQGRCKEFVGSIFEHTEIRLTAEDKRG